MLRSLSALLLLTACATPSTSRPPNVILIMADDVGVEGFSCYGSESYATPNIDRMAAEGLRFTQCHSQPLCTPTRVKLMTGKSNARNYDAFSVLRRGEPTFGHVFQQAGYATAIAGKWQLLAAEHYKPPVRGSGTRPEEAGFDEHCLWQVEKLGSRFWGPTYERNGELVKEDRDVYGPDRYTEFLLEFMERHRNEPFFCYYPMALVHSPFVPTPDSPDRTAKNDPKHFGAMVSYMDALVGRIRAHVEKLGLADDTLILFTADNGTHRKIRSRQRGKDVAGGKNSTLDTGTHVPLVACWPGRIRGGFVCNDLVDFADFIPTLCELTGATTIGDAGCDGVSFAPQLLGERGTPRTAIHCWYHARPKTRPKSRPVRFVRNTRFKLYDDGRFFDLHRDPMEKNSLAGIELHDHAAEALAILRQALADAPPRG